MLVKAKLVQRLVVGRLVLAEQLADAILHRLKTEGTSGMVVVHSPYNTRNVLSEREGRKDQDGSISGF